MALVAVAAMNGQTAGAMLDGQYKQAEALITAALTAPLVVFQATVQEALEAFRSNKEFKRYFHKVYKPDVAVPGAGVDNPDLSPEDIRDAYEEWLELGRPSAD